jgi:hypothetical protein
MRNCRCLVAHSRAPFARRSNVGFGDAKGQVRPRAHRVSAPLSSSSCSSLSRARPHAPSWTMRASRCADAFPPSRAQRAARRRQRENAEAEF